MALFKRPRPASDALPIMGVVRFSVLMREWAEFRLSRETAFEERRATLFDPARLEARFRLFEAITLPSALAQTRDDWTLLVIASSGMPEPFRTRLADLVAPHPNLVLAEMAPDESLPAFLRARLDQVFPEADRHVTFRLDDDDGLSAEFIRGLRRAMATWDKGRDMAFSFPQGHLLGQCGRPGHLLHNAKFHNYGIACGLSLLTTRDFPKGIFDLGTQHRMVDQVVPTVATTDGPAYVLMSHAHNDTGEGSARQRLLDRGSPRTVREIAAAMGPDFAHLDLDRLAS